jgi:hypothetical protein
MRQFRYIQGKIPRKFGCTFPRQFNYVQKDSSGALRREVQVVTSGKTYYNGKFSCDYEGSTSSDYRQFT